MSWQKISSFTESLHSRSLVGNRSLHRRGQAPNSNPALAWPNNTQAEGITHANEKYGLQGCDKKTFKIINCKKVNLCPWAGPSANSFDVVVVITKRKQCPHKSDKQPAPRLIPQISCQDVDIMRQCQITMHWDSLGWPTTPRILKKWVQQPQGAISYVYSMWEERSIYFFFKLSHSFGQGKPYRIAQGQDTQKP